MKVRTYIRIAKNGYKYKVDAHTKEDPTPLYIPSYGGQKKFLPTVAFAVDFNVPDELFSNASRVIAQIDVATKEAVVLGEMLIPTINKIVADAKRTKKKK